MPVRIAIGVLQVHVMQQVPGRMHVIIDRWAACGQVRIIRVAGVERHAHRRAAERGRELDARVRIDILDVLDHQHASDVRGPLHRAVQRGMNALDQSRTAARLVVEIVVVPGRVGRVDHHLGGAERGADVEALRHALAHDVTDVGVVGPDVEAPERPVDAEPAGVAVELALDLGGERFPVAVQDISPEEILHLEIALLLEDPVAMLAQAGKRQRHTKDRESFLCGHG
jgi:hypothetical protein